MKKDNQEEIKELEQQLLKIRLGEDKVLNKDTFSFNPELNKASTKKDRIVQGAFLHVQLKILKAYVDNDEIWNRITKNKEIEDFRQDLWHYTKAKWNKMEEIVLSQMTGEKKEKVLKKLSSIKKINELLKLSYMEAAKEDLGNLSLQQKNKGCSIALLFFSSLLMWLFMIVF